MSTFYSVFETALGVAGLSWNDVGITHLRLPSANLGITARNLLRRARNPIAAEPPPHIAKTVASVRCYFAGERVEFSKVTLDLAGHDDLFCEIYAAARRVGYGETTTYGVLAKAIGRTNWQGARDVGRAMAMNPVALIIPCHRVLAAGGKIGGFSAPGGAKTKEKMLELEGVRLAPRQGALEF